MTREHACAYFKSEHVWLSASELNSDSCHEKRETAGVLVLNLNTLFLLQKNISLIQAIYQIFVCSKE